MFLRWGKGGELRDGTTTNFQAKKKRYKLICKKKHKEQFKKGFLKRGSTLDLPPTLDLSVVRQWTFCRFPKKVLVFKEFEACSFMVRRQKGSRHVNGFRKT